MNHDEIPVSDAELLALVRQVALEKGRPICTLDVVKALGHNMDGTVRQRLAALSETGDLHRVESVSGPHYVSPDLSDVLHLADWLIPRWAK